uniref:glycerophosphodiester phosphodiesterase domain-containing protein 4 n=1 Tax=Jaculus jaculus TaxID=51337 RepID=UPI00064D6B02|nr:glycerophosphodiester phosphodiesterase domain-containing protein 4 [Jaculus jaculus]
MHEDSRHEAGHGKTETSASGHESWVARNFNYQCYITCLTGFYSCRWTAQQWERTEYGSCCCSWREQLFYMFLISACFLSNLVLFVWAETSNEYFSFDWVVYLGTGKWFFCSIILLSFLGIVAMYTSLLLIVSFLLLWERIELSLHISHKILVTASSLLAVFLMAVLCQHWKDKWLIFGLSLKIFAPLVHLILITLMVIASWPIAIYVAHLETEVRIRRYRVENYENEDLETHNKVTRLKALQVAAGLSFLLILLCLYLIPLGIYSPCIQEKKNLGPKPVFFGHRGAPMMAPENTMMSFEKAVEYDIFGLETDVHVSYDHVPFIMHDFDLSRTTNIREVLPEDIHKHTSLFKWPFLSTLNAGKWFLEHKPFINMDPLSEADKKRASNQSIPLLSDVLQLAKKEQKFVIFDLFHPPVEHPYRNTFVRKVVRVILESKIEQHLIFWLPSFDRSYVRYMAPGFQQVGRLLPTERLTRENISIINVDYKRLFYRGMREYKAANIYINLYLVNEPWLFSLAWCSKINSVTTDNIKLLSQLNHPHFFMTPSYYMYVWLLMDIVSAVFICIIFTFHWWRELKKKRWLNPTNATPGKMRGLARSFLFILAIDSGRRDLLDMFLTSAKRDDTRILLVQGEFRVEHRRG